MLTFSNACLLEEDDSEDLVRYTSVPIGEWYVANDKRHRVRTYARKFQLTARQIVEKFCKKKPDGTWDFSNVSDNVKQLFVNSNTENWIEILHMIMPNDHYEAGKLGAKGQKVYLGLLGIWEYGRENFLMAIMGLIERGEPIHCGFPATTASLSMSDAGG